MGLGATMAWPGGGSTYVPPDQGPKLALWRPRCVAQVRLGWRCKRPTETYESDYCWQHRPFSGSTDA